MKRKKKIIFAETIIWRIFSHVTVRYITQREIYLFRCLYVLKYDIIELCACDFKQTGTENVIFEVILKMDD